MEFNKISLKITGDDEISIKTLIKTPWFSDIVDIIINKDSIIINNENEIRGYRLTKTEYGGYKLKEFNLE